MMRRAAVCRLVPMLVMVCLPAAASPPAGASSPPISIVLASTTSTEQSGLFARLMPAFTRDTGISVRVLALGTGQALDVARRGDADLVLVHDEQAERRFVDEGWGIDRRPVMRNDYVIVGPASDPAGTAGADAVAAMARIARAGATFVSRGDRSGTHAAELALWRAAGIDPPAVARAAHWYRESGSGMGATLNVAAGLDAYTLADRATWLAFRNPARLAVLVEGDPGLVNRYCVILVNPARHPHVKREAAQRLADWLVSPPGRAAIDGFRIGGRQVFFAHPPR